MTNKVKKFIEENNLIDENDNIVIGVSGGADSICLLCVLDELYSGTNVKLHVVHINHGLRASALHDQMYVEKVCRDLGIPCDAFELDVKGYAALNGVSTEEAGRVLRYETFASVLRKCGQGKIAVAHNLDDNAETMLHNMFRGTGLKGMKGIAVKRDNIIRPLLCLRRSEIEAYLKSINVDFCIDETNLQDDYTRNRIRHNIIPLAVKEVNERAVENMQQLSENISLADDFLMKEVARAMREVTVTTKVGHYKKPDAKVSVVISKEKYDKLHPYIQKRLLLETMGLISGTKKDLQSVHVNLLHNLFELQNGRSLDLPYRIKATRIYEGVQLSVGTDTALHDETQTLEEEKTNRSEESHLNNGNELDCIVFGCEGAVDDKFFRNRIFAYNGEDIPKERYTKWFDYDKIVDGVVIRTREEGDYLVVDDDGNRQKLKAYFVNEKIPASVRWRLPLIAVKSHVLWVIGHRISSDVKVTKDTKKVLEIRYNGPEI